MELDKELTAETVEYILQLDSVQEIISSITIDEEILANQNETLKEIANKEINTLQSDNIEEYYTQIVEVQAETLESIKSILQVQFLLIGLALGIVVIVVLLRGIFRNAGN